VKPRALILSVVAALLISGLCTFALSRTMGRGPAPVVVEGKIVAPARTLQAGEALKAEDVALVAWPRSNVLAGSFVRTSDVVGRVVLFPLEKGEPVLERDLAAAGSAAGLSAKIPEGKRAIALKSDEVVGVGGFLMPGSHVDVLATYHPVGQQEVPVTATVLQNAVVLAAGQQIEPDPSGKASAVTVVTLLLTPEESERAILASNQGSIHLVLRNGGDGGRAVVAPVSMTQLAGGAAPVERAPVVAEKTTVARPAAKAEEIETILGDGKTVPKPDGGNVR